jgi:cell division septum initiation protein DivIVA
VSSTDNTGLGLFDDMASAAGSFPTALRGYDRSAVDEYVRSLEGNVVATRRHAQELLEQMARLEEQTQAETEQQQVDYSDLGSRASEILRLAQEQARDLTENAHAEAERVKDLARREAEDLRRQAAREKEGKR